ncbi:hypothetical protein [Streptomyces bambusae]|uniref:Cytochrome c domain-containing protein n=1 Tax=Streptomyces bambusae TaxID=1550616 RepID=A0ABS6Z721_9ACTN|nr:hypothetical protein [Streptomyces bambusae]MBW5482480.1 hypothetical protein [Streptomyces bambusae]
MQLPPDAVAATVLLTSVRLTEPWPRPGKEVGAWEGAEMDEVLDLIHALPGSRQYRCGFRPGWSVRAYDERVAEPLFEAAFCFSCHEARLTGSAVHGRALATQFFDPDSPQGQELLARLRASAERGSST